MEPHELESARVEPTQALKTLLLKPATAVAVVIGLALALRLYLIPFHDVISTDGTSYVRTAKALGSGTIDGLGVYGFYPVLVWIFSLPGLEMETAGRLVSAIAGSLLVLPVYLLGKELFSRRAALVACLLTAVWPPLVSWACEVMTQAAYITLVLAGIYLVWRMLNKPSPVAGAMAGLLMALAFMTRPEGLLLFFIMPLIPLWRHRRQLKERALTIAAYAVAFTCIFCIDLFLVHHVTGHWQLSAKTGSALTDALGYYLRITDYAYRPEIKQVGYLDILKDYPDFIWSNSLGNMKKLLLTLLPTPLWLLAVWGCCSGGLQREGNLARLFLLSSLAPLGVIILFYYVSPEYTQQYLPAFFLLIGEGGTRLESLVVGRIDRLSPYVCRQWQNLAPVTFVVFLAFAGSIAARQLPAKPVDVFYLPEMDGGRRDQKNMGLVLKQHLPPGKLMTRWARIAYYADREYAAMPNAGMDEVLRAARENGVRFLVIDGGLYQYRPDLELLFTPFLNNTFPERILLISPHEETITGTGLRPYLLYKDPSSEGVAVYELVS
jgi:4-amino-4-deoxy-L-arabinose transferase-like glycosyltransferase